MDILNNHTSGDIQIGMGNETLLAWLNEEIEALGEEQFFHADYEATLADTYGLEYEETLVVEGGVPAEAAEEAETGAEDAEAAAETVEAETGAEDAEAAAETVESETGAEDAEAAAEAAETEAVTE